MFADTGYWIALLNSRDELHRKASDVSRNFAPTQIVTSEMVLTEFLNSFSGYGTSLRHAAARAVDSLRQSSVLVLPQTSQLFELAFQRYRNMGDKGWSLTDCSSFILMEQERLTAALTYDRHFTQAGFQILLR
ncbi:MAG TPA: PIN domain-containing protein [Acidobacteriaceae bacterium]|nr:PIN domain-containing protein [Acidobacteriaceae bacterium]